MNTVKKVLNRSTSRSSASSASSLENDTRATHNRRVSNSTSATSDGIHERHNSHTKTKVPLVPSVGRSADVHTKDGSIRHSNGHVYKNEHLDLTKGSVEQDIQHLAHITKQTHHRHEVEEVIREKDHHRHVHHIQHHTQPIYDSEHAAEQVHSNIVPETKVYETHASTDKDAALLTSVAGKYKDEYHEAGLDRKVVDKGERVRENIHHHIHNVVQPIIEKDTHEYHRIQTVIPSTVVTHEAPIIHESTHQKPISKAEFLKGGGLIGSNITSVHEANLLNTGKCDRTVTGVAEDLEKRLGLARNNSSNNVQAV